MARIDLAHHGVNQLDAIVFCRVMTGSNHNANPLSTQLLGPEASKQAHSKHHGVEEVAVLWSERK